MKRWATLVAIVLIAPLVGAQAIASYSLTKVGGIAGENGVFASQDGLITVYSDQTVRVQYGSDPKWKFIDNTGNVSFGFKEGVMKRVPDTIPLAAAHEFAFCDPLNQVDVWKTMDSGVGSLLPKGSRMKATESLGESYLLVVYATNASTSRYDLRFALMKGNNTEKYRLIRSDIVSAGGSYCGIQSIGENYRVIMTDEPTGSSDFSVEYVFAVKSQ
jgi:hypothetical protein